MPVIDEYNLPDELYYTDDHAWVKVEDGGRIRMGMNDFAQKLAGEMSFVKVPKVGKAAKKGKVLFSVQSGKWAGKLKSPVDGTIVEANEELVYEPAKINQDCYGAGWVAVVQAENLEADLGQLIHGADRVTAWLQGEIAEHVKK